MCDSVEAGLDTRLAHLLSLLVGIGSNLQQESILAFGDLMLVFEPTWVVH